MANEQQVDAPLAPQQIPLVFRFIYWAGVCGTIVSWIVVGTLLLLNRLPPAWGISHLGVSVIILCLILWLGHVTEYRLLRGRMPTAIWTSFILSVLVTGATAFRTIFYSQHVRIERFVLLDESFIRPHGQGTVLADIASRPNNNYVWKRDADFNMSIALVISDYKPDSFGKLSVTGDLILRSETKRIADLGSLPTTETANAWKTRSIITNLGPARVATFLGAKPGQLIFVQNLRHIDPAALAPGRATLRVVVRDEVGHSFDQRTEELFIE